MRNGKKSSIKSLLLGFFLGVGITFGTAAFAFGDAAIGAKMIIDFLKSNLMESFQSAITDLKSEFITSNEKEGGRTAKAIGAATDAKNKLSVDLYNATIEFQSKRQNNICESNDIAVNLKTSEATRDKRIPVLGKPILDSNISSENVTTQIERIINTHEKNFCGYQDANCKPSEYSNADLAAWNLLKNEGYNEKELLAAYNYMAISTNPRPRPALPKHVHNTVQGKEARSVMMEESAHLSASQNSYLNYISDRTKSKTRQNNEDQSLFDIKEEEVNRRWGNPDWVNDISSDSYVPAIKETAMMMAYQLKQNHDQEKRFERIELLLATLVAIEAKRAANESLSTIRPRASEAINEKP